MGKDKIFTSARGVLLGIVCLMAAGVVTFLSLTKGDLLALFQKEPATLTPVGEEDLTGEPEDTEVDFDYSSISGSVLCVGYYNLADAGVPTEEINGTLDDCLTQYLESVGYQSPGEEEVIEATILAGNIENGKAFYRFYVVLDADGTKIKCIYSPGEKGYVFSSKLDYD